MSDGPINFGDRLVEEIRTRCVVNVSVFFADGSHDVIGNTLHERRRDVQRGVRNGMGDVQKEWLVFVSVNERDRTFRDPFGQEVSVGFHFDDGVVLQQRQRWELVVILPRMKRMNVVAVGKAKELIKALFRREEFWLVAEVPFAKHAGPIARCFQDFRDGDFIGMQAFAIASQQHSEIGTHRHADPFGIATRHQPGS